MDRSRMEQGIRAFLDGIGQRFPDDDLDATPARVTRAWADELVSGYATDPDSVLSWIPAPPGGGVVLVREVAFVSVCVHHLLPFAGLAHVAYLPAGRLAGLSKIGRVIDAHSRRLQIQERLTTEITTSLDRVLEPRGVLTVLEAEHTCMTLRGGRKERSRMLTMRAAGLYDVDAPARREVLDLLLTSGDGMRGGGR